MKVLFLNSINATLCSDEFKITFINAKYPMGINMDDIPNEAFKDLTEEEIQQVWDTFKIDLNPNDDKPQFAEESFIKSVEDAYNTGGDILNDIITLKNGMTIQISEDGLSIYKNDEDRVYGNNVIFWYDENDDTCWCRSCKKG